MPDPINPRLSDDALVEHILRQHPSLTLDAVIEAFAAAGYDVRVSPDLRRWLQCEQRPQ